MLPAKLISPWTSELVLIGVGRSQPSHHHYWFRNSGMCWSAESTGPAPATCSGTGVWISQVLSCNNRSWLWVIQHFTNLLKGQWVGGSQDHKESWRSRLQAKLAQTTPQCRATRKLLPPPSSGCGRCRLYPSCFCARSSTLLQPLMPALQEGERREEKQALYFSSCITSWSKSPVSVSGEQNLASTLGRWD